MPNLDGNPAGPSTGDTVLGASFLVLGSGTGESLLTARRTLTAGSNVTFTDNGPGGTLVINASGGGGGSISDGDKGDITVSSSGAVWTIDNAAVTSAKLRNSIARSVIGAAGGAGTPNDIQAGSGSNTVLLERAGSLVFATIQSTNMDDGAVTFAKLQDSGAGLSVIGRAGNTSGDFAEITGTAAQVLCVNDAGTAVGFQVISNNSFSNNTIAHSRLVNLAGASVLGRSATGSGAMAAITGSTIGHVLTVQADNTLAFSAPSGGGGGSIDGSGAATRMAFWSDADTLTSDAGFTFASATLTNTATAADAKFVAGISAGSQATFGCDDSDSDSAVICLGTALGTNNVLRAITNSTTVQNSSGNAKLLMDDTLGTTLYYGTQEYINVNLSDVEVVVNNGYALRLRSVGATGSGLSNAALFGTGSFGGGSQVLFVNNAAVAPTTNPSGGAIWYVESGASKARGSSGTVTTFANAEPHCPVCGRDYMKEFDNAEYGYFAFCLPCLADELGERSWIVRGPSRLRGA